MSVLTLEVQSRNAAETKAKHVRKEGNIPAVLYGKDREGVSLQMDYQTFRKLFRQAGESSLIELVIDGKDKETVLVHDYQLHPVTDDFTHVDFLVVNMKEEITTSVHIEIVGVSPAVKDLGGVLSVPRQEVEVKCLPKDMPHHLELDISSIEDFHTTLHVSDLVVPEGVEVVTEGELTLATVAAPREESAEEVAEEAAGGAEEGGEAAGGEGEAKEEGSE